MKTFIDNVEITFHYLTDTTIFIDLFFVPVHLQGNGFGKLALEKFEKSLPKEIKEIRLLAATNLNGRVCSFWHKQGFSFLYDVKEHCFEEEVLYSMTKAVNGGNTRKFIYSESIEDEIDCF